MKTMTAFVWNGIVCEQYEDVGFVLSREATEEDNDLPTLTDQEVVERFYRDGCYAGDAEFNWVVRLTAQRVAATR